MTLRLIFQNRVTYDDVRTRTATSVKKVILMNEGGKNNPMNTLLLTLVCCLMMARRLHACEMGLKFAALLKIMPVIMMSFYDNVRSSKRLTVVVAFT